MNIFVYPLEDILEYFSLIICQWFIVHKLIIIDFGCNTLISHKGVNNYIGWLI